jgi:AcrR family transcriptional regulator
MGIANVQGAGRLPRGTLSADQIVVAACDLTSQVGLQGFSMPQVAKHLGVGVTSVYWHFRSKDDLLSALADRVTAEFYAGLDDGASLVGEDRVLYYFRTFWIRLRENPLWREVFISHFRRTVSSSPEASLRAAHVHHRQVLRMVDAGLTLEAAANAHTILSAYTRGYVLVEHLRLLDTVSAVLNPDVSMVPGLESYGRVRAALAATEPDDTFETGLKALWRGLAGHAEPSPLPAAPSRAAARKRVVH